MSHKECLEQRIRIRVFFLIVIMFLISLTLTGCSDMVEIQDRDFVLALGISYTDKYNITFALPDLDAITGQSNEKAKERLLRSFNAKTLPEIEVFYNLDSEKKLDYRHLKAIILDGSMFLSQEKLMEFLRYIDNQYTLSRNVLLFYYPDDANKLMDMNETVGGSIGDYLKKLNKNNLNMQDAATLGSIINCLDNTRSLLIPMLKEEETSISLNGGALFYKDSELKIISEEQRKIYNILQGKGTDYVFRIGDDVIRLKDVKCKTKYEFTNKIPYIQFNITGISENLQSNSNKDIPVSNKLKQYLETIIKEELNTLLKQDHIDFLNLYEASSYKNSDIWFKYEGKMTGFIDDLQIGIYIEIK